MGPSSLGFYRLLERVGWLRTYASKFLFVAFVGTHIPLLALIAYFANAGIRVGGSSVFWIMLGATLAGTIGVLWTLRQLLQPILLAGQALNRYLLQGEVTELPDDLRDEAGLLLRDVAGTIRAVAANQRELQRSAITDALTGLLNRRGATERLRDSLFRHDPVFVALLDLDRFKQLNDRWGHGIGDMALQAMSGYLTEFTGSQQGQGSNAWTARWGGEEFLVVLPDAGNAAQAQAMLEELRRNVPSLNLGEDGKQELAVSIGVTEARRGEMTEEVLQRADTALYAAKRAGRDQVHIFTPAYPSGLRTPQGKLDGIDTVGGSRA